MIGSVAERKVCWRVTRACNLACSHCLAGWKNSFISDLALDAQLDVMAALIVSGVERITWAGGEPTLSPGFTRLLERGRECGIRNVITTHGLTLTRKFIESMDPTTDTVRVSFDGLAETHDRIRGGAYFSRTLRAVDRLRASGIPVEANVTLTRQNFEQLPDLARILVDHGLKRVVLLSLLLRESALIGDVDPLTCRQATTLRQYLANGELPNGIRYQWNDYSVAQDRYVVIESNGQIILCTESAPDRHLGSAVGGDAARRLRRALDLQNLAHRIEPLRVVAVGHG